MKYFITILSLCSISFSFSQDCDPPSSTQEFSANNISIIINSGEAQFTNLAGSGPGFEVPAGNGIHSIYSSNFWIGGITADEQLKLAAGTYASELTDYYNGPLSTEGNAEVASETCGEYDQLVTVCEYESLRHLEYFDCLSNPECEISEAFPNGYTTPEVFANYPAHGNTTLGQDYYLAPFFDYNSDGAYIPEDGDCPLFVSMTEDLVCYNCNALSGHKATFWITNDKGGLHSASNGETIGVEIHNVVYAYSSTNYLNDVVFFQKKLINRGSQTLSNTYIGTWADLDLGNPNDDLLGCDINRNLAFGYNGDAFDESSSGSEGYQEFPPAVGIKVLEGITSDMLGEDDLLMTNFSSLNSGNGPFGDPQLASNYYNYMKSIDLSGQPYTAPGTDITTTWMTAGDTYANSEISWSDELPADKKMLLSTGPFTFLPEDEQCITNAFIHARSETEDISSLDSLLSIADSVQSNFDGCFSCVPPKADIQLALTGNLTFEFHNLATADNYQWDFGDGTSSSSMVAAKTFDPSLEYEIILELSNECGSDADTLLLSFEPMNISEQIETLSLEVFPNPAHDQITLSSKKDLLLAVQLFDTTGKLVLSDNVRTNTTLDLSSVSSGHYILSATNAQNSSVFREQLILFNN